MDARAGVTSVTGDTGAGRCENGLCDGLKQWGLTHHQTCDLNLTFGARVTSLQGSMSQSNIAKGPDHNLTELK